MYIKSKKFKEYQHYIYFIEVHSSVEKLIKYNIYSRRKHVVFQSKSICNYYVFCSDLIIDFYDNKSLRYIFWDKHTKSKHYIINCIDTISILFIRNELYIIIIGDGTSRVYGFNGLIKYIPDFWIHTSNDGKRIIRYNPPESYAVLDVDSLDHVFDTHFCDYTKKIPISLDWTVRMRWIQPNLLYFMQGPCVYLYNPDTNNIYAPEYISYRHKIYVVNGNAFIVCKEECQIYVYNIDTLKLIAIVSTNLKIIGANNHFGILITEGFKYYKFNDVGCFENCNVRYNYVIDRIHVYGIVKFVMDIMLEIIDLPDEILCIELYQAMIYITKNTCNDHYE